MADEVCEALRLDRLLLVPAAQPPHKPAAELAPAAHLYRMTALAVREHPRFEVSDVEIKRSGPSYTVDTLAALQDRGRLHVRKVPADPIAATAGIIKRRPGEPLWTQQMVEEHRTEVEREEQAMQESRKRREALVRSGKRSA